MSERDERRKKSARVWRICRPGATIERRSRHTDRNGGGDEARAVWSLHSMETEGKLGADLQVTLSAVSRCRVVPLDRVAPAAYWGADPQYDSMLEMPCHPDELYLWCTQSKSPDENPGFLAVLRRG